MKLTSAEIAALDLDIPPHEVQAVFNELYEALGANAVAKWLALTVTADLAQLRASGARVDLRQEIDKHQDRRRSEFVDARDRAATRSALYRNVLTVLRLRTELARVTRGEPCSYVPEP